MKVTQLNHVAVDVTDLAVSDAFYCDVLGLKKIDRPAFNFPGSWFRLGIDQELHLLARPTSERAPARDRHWAMMVDDINAFAKHLREQQIEFTGPKPRPDGAHQIFLRDPDGHVIELCTRPGKLSS